MLRRAGIALAVIAVATLTLHAALRLDQLTAGRSRTDSLLYLPNGKHLRVASLGQAPLLADMIYLWAIQYYSEYEREDRFRYVEHVFGDVIAQLDPQYIDAYWMGALILSVEARDLEAGLRLLDLGFEHNPEAWILPYLAGWECYHYGEPQRAEAYFRTAEAVTGAPDYVHRTRIGMVARIGDLDRAAGLWLQVLQDPAADAMTIDIAERQLRYLKIRIDLRDLQARVAAFRNDNARWPNSLVELRERGYIRNLPRDPYERPYGYDSTTGRVSADSGRILPESP